MHRSLQPDGPQLAQPRSTNSIGFLRVVLAAMVIYTHSYYLGGFAKEPLERWTNGALTAGGLAVQCFFVLSGWLVASSWLRLNSLPVFLWHRILRLAPGFWVCLIVTAVIFGPLVHWTSMGPRLSYFALDPPATGYVWHNLWQPRGQISIGDLVTHNPHPGDLNGSLWTLFYEASCYLAVAACGLALLLGRGGRLIFVLGLGILLVLHPLARAGILPSIVLRLFDTPGKIMCWHFATGSVCAIFPSLTLWLGHNRWAALTGLVALVAAWASDFGPIISPVALPLLLFWLAEKLPIRNWERHVGGDYSYGLYVYGYPVQQLLAHWGVQQLGLTLYTLMSLFLAGTFAWLSWHHIEKPALGLRHARFGRRVHRTEVHD